MAAAVGPPPDGAGVDRPTPIARCVRAPAGFIEPLRHLESCAAALATLNPPHIESKRRHGGSGMNMRAETQSLVEEIKQSVRLLRRHL